MNLHCLLPFAAVSCLIMNAAGASADSAVLARSPHAVLSLDGPWQTASAATKADAKAWKDKLFKQHPEDDADHDGMLTWPEYKAYKAKLDAGKSKANQTNSSTITRTP